MAEPECESAHSADSPIEPDGACELRTTQSKDGVPAISVIPSDSCA
jgi:hypothetical protein